MTISEREQRGLAIAALCRLRGKNGVWEVPSQSGNGTYTVEHGATPRCSCPDFETRQCKCKHVFAVEFTIERERNFDGSETLTRSMTVTEKVTTYKQNWPAYDRAQSIEKDRFQELLVDLCSGLQEPAYKGRGRPAHSIRDSVFAMVFKIYSTLSGRRFSSDLREAHRRGHLSRSIPGQKVSYFLENPELTPILKELIVRSSLPLRAVETSFAIDSSGFSTSKFVRWFDIKYGVSRQQQVWVKAHIACGTKTNVVTAIRILDKDAADCPQFIPLVEETRKGFKIGEVSADKAYLSLENFEAVAGCGGTAFIAFKGNSTGGVGGLFQKMFHYFQYRKDEFLAHYHKRSNVESTFSMIKRKFGDAVRSKSDVAMVNEVLCKILAHNLSVLIHEQCELGIETEFWTDKPNTLPMVGDDIDVTPSDAAEYDFAELAFV
jgi:transposase